MLEEQYNLRSPAVKRILREAAELKDSTYEYFAQPLEDNIFEWHFTVRGAADTDFSGGFYHGRIILPNDYPMKPPSIILLTPNGRFEVRKKICLSISGYHPESWQPCWSIRTVLLAIIAFMPTKAEGFLGSIDYTAAERAILARKSHRWSCPNCGLVKDHLKESPSLQPAVQTSKSDQEFLDKVSFKGETSSSTKNSSTTDKPTLEKSSTEQAEVNTIAEVDETENRDNEGNGPRSSLSSLTSTTTSDNSSVTDSSNLPARIRPSSSLLSSPETESNDPESSTSSVDANSTGTTATSITSNLLIHGPLANFFLFAIIAMIVALLIRRVCYYL